MKVRGLLPVVAIASGSAFAACGNGKLPPIALRPPVSVGVTPAASVAPAPPRPAPLAATRIGSFGEGTFGPRVARNGKGAIVVSAPRGDTGRRWFARALDDQDRPIGSEHEIAEAPEDASSWDLKPVGDGYVLAWTRPSDTGEQLLSVALAADGSPRSAPTVVARSGDDLVAVRLVRLGDAVSAGALLTWGEKTVPKGAISATGTLYALALDTLGRPSAPEPTRVAEKLSAWQVAATGPSSAIVALVQRAQAKAAKDKDEKKDEKLAAREELVRNARALTVTASTKGLVTSDALVLSGDDALPEIDVVQTAPGRALVVWSDRREVDAHLFGVSLDVAGPKPKALAAARRVAPPHGDQAIVSLVATGGGAAVLLEIVSPRSVRDPRRRFQLSRLSLDGEAVARPRGFWFPYEGDEPELVRAGDDEVAVLTYGSACYGVGAEARCDPGEVRPWVLRFGGPTLAPKQVDVVDVGSATTGPAMHAFDLSCPTASPPPSARCEVLATGSGTPANVALAQVVMRGEAKPSEPRWIFREWIDTPSAPPRLEGATALAREPEFTGLHATRAGAGALVGWITYAPDDLDLKPADEPKGKKGGAKPKPKKPKAETGARVAVRLLDGAGEPLGPIATISEKALSKGDVAVAWSTVDGQGGLVSYVSRAEGEEDVYVARVDAKGAKTGKSTRITNVKGPVSDVALAALPEGGYLLGWVESRKGAPAAVYALRLDKSGGKVGNEARIGGGVAGDVSDLALSAIGSGAGGARVVAVWSDARDDATHGYADVYYAIVGSKDPSKPVVAERPIARNKTHSHYPLITPRGDGGALIAWVEDDPSASEFLELVGRPEWGARFARIDAQGNIVQAATELGVDAALGKGVATGVAAECPTGASSCRLAVAWATREGIVLAGAALGATSTPSAARALWSWFGAPSQEVAPAIVGSTVYACEDGLEKDDGRVRRLSIGW